MSAKTGCKLYIVGISNSFVVDVKHTDGMLPHKNHNSTFKGKREKVDNLFIIYY